MNNFRTELNISPSSARIRLTDSILTVGSCFSDAIGSQLILNKLATLVNPFGTIYNPLSIHKAIQYSTSERPVLETSFAHRQDSVLHYDFHSQFSAGDQEDLKNLLQSALSDTHKFLRTSQWLIITYGTSWVYELKETSSVVANCHKMLRYFSTNFF